MKRSICLIMMVEHPAELTDVSCKKQAGSPKNFHQQASFFLQYSSKWFQSTQDIISTRHCFSPGLWHCTMMANIFRLIQSEQKFNCGWRRGSRDRQSGGCVCLRQLTWNKGPEDISHPSLVTIYSSWAIWQKGTLIPSSVLGQQIAAVLQDTTY